MQFRDVHSLAMLAFSAHETSVSRALPALCCLCTPHLFIIDCLYYCQKLALALVSCTHIIIAPRACMFARALAARKSWRVGCVFKQCAGSRIYVQFHVVHGGPSSRQSTRYSVEIDIFIVTHWCSGTEHACAYLMHTHACDLIRVVAGGRTARSPDGRPTCAQV